MAQDSSVSISPDNVLQYVPGKFARAFFTTNKLASITKKQALDYKTYLTSEEDAEQALGYAFGPAFRIAAAENGWTLVDSLNYILEQIDAEAPSDDRLASLLSQLAPNETPEELADRFRNLVDMLPAAVVRLQELLDKNGRDDDEYIRIRAKAVPKKEVAQ